MKKNLFNIFASIITVLATVPAFAEEAAHAAGGNSGLLALGAGLAVSLAALGGALGQGKAVAAAMDAISRNPAAQGKLFTPMIIGLALIETIVLFAWLIAFLIQGKI